MQVDPEHVGRAAGKEKETIKREIIPSTSTHIEVVERIQEEK